MRWRFRILLTTIIMVYASPVIAADEVNEFLGNVAEDLASFLRGKRQNSVVVRFTGPTTMASAAAGGDALTQLLSEKLKAQSIAVNQRADYGLNGRFQINLNEKPIKAKLTAQIVDANDAPVYEVKFADGFITKPRKMSELFGLTTDFQYPPNHQQPNFDNLPGNQDDRIRSSLKKPHVFIQDSKVVKATGQSPYAMEILVGEQPRSITNRNGEAFTSVDLGEEYLIRLTNGSKNEAAIAVTVDGLNVFQFSQLKATTGERKGQSKYQYYIVPPGRSHVIRGWHMNEVNGQASLKGFRVTPMEDSLAAKLGRPARIGMITATFHHSWSDGQQAPNDEPEVFPQLPPKWEKKEVKEIGPDGKERMVKTRIPIPMYANVGTTFGSDSTASMTGVKRTIGIERASITIRYERPDKR